MYIFFYLLFKKWLNLAKQAVKIQVKSIQGTYSEDIIEQNLLAYEIKALFTTGMKRAAKDMDIDEEMDEELDTSLNVKDLKSKSKSSPRKKVAKIVTEIEADAEMEEN